LPWRRFLAADRHLTCRGCGSIISSLSLSDSAICALALAANAKQSEKITATLQMSLRAGSGRVDFSGNKVTLKLLSRATIALD
jgi:hypothetical protein